MHKFMRKKVNILSSIKAPIVIFISMHESKMKRFPDIMHRKRWKQSGLA